MYDRQAIQSIEQDTDFVTEAEHRMIRYPVRGTLADLLAMIPALTEIYERRLAMHGWRVVANMPVMLGKLRELQAAVDAGILTPTAPLMALHRLEIFSRFRMQYAEAMEVVAETLRPDDSA